MYLLYFTYVIQFYIKCINLKYPLVLSVLSARRVRDGDIAGVDLNLQLSVTTLSANWDGFDQPKPDSNGLLVSRTLIKFAYFLSISLCTSFIYLTDWLNFNVFKLCHINERGQ